MACHWPAAPLLLNSQLPWTVPCAPINFRSSCFACVWSRRPAPARSLWAQSSDITRLPGPIAPLPNEKLTDTAEPQPAATVLTLDQLEQRALQVHPTITEASWLLQAGRWNWLQVGLPPNPTVGYMASEIGNEGRAGQQGAFVEQMFLRGQKLPLNRSVAQHEVERLQQELAARQQRVLTDVRIAFYQLLALESRVMMLGRMEQITQQAATTAEQLFQAASRPRPITCWPGFSSNASVWIARPASESWKVPGASWPRESASTACRPVRFKATWNTPRRSWIGTARCRCCWPITRSSPRPRPTFAELEAPSRAPERRSSRT